MGAAMMKRGFAGLVFVGAALLAAQPARAGLIEEMVLLERAYVPALGITNQAGKDAQSREAMRRLASAWARFLENTRAEAKQDAALAGALGEAGGSIAKASATLERGGSLADAHDALEGVRATLWKWRAARGIDHFPDLLTAYHDAMEHLADLATSASPDEARLRQALTEAGARWARVESAPFDAALFGFPPDKVARMKGLIAKERALLAELEALAGADRERRAGAVKTMKGTFAQIYFLFGDFDGLQ